MAPVTHAHVYTHTHTHTQIYIKSSNTFWFHINSLNTDAKHWEWFVVRILVSVNTWNWYPPSTQISVGFRCVRQLKIFSLQHQSTNILSKILLLKIQTENIYVIQCPCMSMYFTHLSERLSTPHPPCCHGKWWFQILVCTVMINCVLLLCMCWGWRKCWASSIQHNTAPLEGSTLRLVFGLS